MTTPSRPSGPTGQFPRSMAELGDWARRAGVPVAEARLRFAQYGALCGIASVPALRMGLVFKGGNALDFVWQPNRSTIDLDFSMDMAGASFDASPHRIQNLLAQGLRSISERVGIGYAVHRVRQNPPGADRTFITYEARIGYALPDQHRLRMDQEQGRPSSQVLPIEISLNEPICDDGAVLIHPELRPLRVCTREDIVAEKLRALLQQPLRNRHRCQDLLDIAVIVTRGEPVDRIRVAEYLLVKAAARDVPVTRVAFRHPEIAARARVDYAALEPTTRTVFLPFDEALTTVLSLVDELSIPEE